MTHYTADAVLAAGHTVHPSGDRYAVIVLDAEDTAQDPDPTWPAPSIQGPAVVQYERCRDGRVTAYEWERTTAPTGRLDLGPAAGLLIDGPSPYSQLVAETLAAWYR